MRYPADPMAMFKVMNKVKPFDSSEQLVANQTPLQMQKAMVEVIRRMDAGEVQT